MIRLKDLLVEQPEYPNKIYRARNLDQIDLTWDTKSYDDAKQLFNYANEKHSGFIKRTGITALDIYQNPGIETMLKNYIWKQEGDIDNSTLIGDLGNMLDNLSDSFADTKFYSVFKQIQNDIKADWNSIWDPNSEKRQKFAYDMNRFREATAGLLECWSEWDCFINGETHGIRTFLYSLQGVGTQVAVQFAGKLNPIGVIGIEAAYCLLLVDDVKRMNEIPISETMLNFIFDLAGLLTAGSTGMIGPKLRQYAKQFAGLMNLAFEAGERALTKGFYLRKETKAKEIFDYIKSLGTTAHNALIELIKGLLNLLPKAIGGLNSIINAGFSALRKSMPLLTPVIAPLQSIITTFIASVQTFTNKFTNYAAVVLQWLYDALEDLTNAGETKVDESYIKLKPIIINNVKFT
jgi:hypothetical protein